MTYELEINGLNARAVWGVTIADGSLSALMTPAPMKDYITNESASVHGKIIANSASAMPKIDSRDVQLTMYIHAATTSEFFSKYRSFVSELHKGEIVLRTKYEDDVYYHLYYISCSQFSQFNGRLGKFIVRFNEPNPNHRNDD